MHMLLLCLIFKNQNFVFYQILKPKNFNVLLLQVVFDIKKAEVGVRYRVVVDDYGIRQLIPIDVPVYTEEVNDKYDHCLFAL